MQPFLTGLAQRTGWTAFTALLGRWVGPQIGQYVIAQTVQPYIAPMAVIGIGAALGGQVLQRLTNRYRGIVQWLNQTAGVFGSLTVVLGVVYIVAWRNQGPIGRLIAGVTGAFANMGTISTSDAQILLLSD